MTENSRAKGFGILRIAFGLVWLIDAYFKWSPSFIANFVGYLETGAQNQSPLVAGWIGFWINVVNVNPHFFAVVVAVAETAIALSIISGVLSKYAMYGGIAMAFVIWSTAEGFGGPYSAGSTDIGAAIIYILVFVALLLGNSSRYYNLGAWLRKKLFHSRTYQCPECGLFYPTKELAERCQKWCSEHKSCNLEIIQHALKNK